MLAIPLIRTDDEKTLTPIERTTIACEQIITALMMQGTLMDPNVTPQEMDRVGEYMVVDNRFTPAQSPDVRTYEVQGSTGNTYTVTQDGDTWTCTCPGFGWRRKCRHITEVKDASR